MSQDVTKKLEANKESALVQIIDILVKVSDGIELSDTEKAQHSFDLLERLNAVCIAEISQNLESASEICDAMAKRVKSVALYVYSEKKKAENEETADSGGVTSAAKVNNGRNNVRDNRAQRLSSVMNNAQRPVFNRG